MENAVDNSVRYLALGDSISIDDHTEVAGGGAASQFAKLPADPSITGYIEPNLAGANAIACRRHDIYRSKDRNEKAAAEPS